MSENGRPIIALRARHMSVANWIAIGGIIVGGVWATADLYFRVDQQAKLAIERKNTIDKRIAANETTLATMGQDMADIKTKLAVNGAVQRTIVEGLTRIERQLEKLSDRFNTKPKP